MAGHELTSTRCQSHDDVGHTPYTDSYLAARSPRRNMAPPPPMGPALDTFNTTAVLNTELDNLINPGSGLAPRFQERPNFPEAFGSIDASPQHIQLPSMKQSLPDHNPLMRFYKDTADPWNSQLVSGHLGQDPMELTNARTYVPNSPSNPNVHYYHSSPRSAVSSSMTHKHHLDSGYGTRSVMSDSALSLGHTGQSQGGQSISGDVHAFHSYQDQNSYDTGSVFSQDNQYGSVDMANDVSPETNPLYPMKCDHAGCNKQSRNYSEYKYVSCRSSHLNRLKGALLGSMCRGTRDRISVQQTTVPRTSVQIMIWRDTKSQSTK